MTLPTRVQNKVGPYFDILEAAMAEGDTNLAEDMLDKISPYFHMLDDEHIDYYQGCQYAIETDMVHCFAKKDDYDEPTEYDEWQSFDQDC